MLKGEEEKLFKQLVNDNNKASQSEIIKMLLHSFQEQKRFEKPINKKAKEPNKLNSTGKMNIVIDSVLAWNVEQSKSDLLPMYIYLSESLICTQLGFSRSLAKKVFDIRSAEIELQKRKLKISREMNLLYRDKDKRNEFTFFGKKRKNVMNILIDAINKYNKVIEEYEK